LYCGDNDFAKFLHEQGYCIDKQRFKFFTFSRLFISDFEIIDDRMEINCNTISFVVSFLLDKVAQNMILGIFQNQHFRLGDRITQVELSVESINAINLDIPSETVLIKTTSPLVVVEYQTLSEGKSRQKYLHPLEQNFEKCLINNLLSKYEVAYKYHLVKTVEYKRDRIKVRVLSSRIKKKATRIKAQTKSETTVVGYICSFELTAPKELIRLGVLAGFGRMNAEGFGATKVEE